MFHYLLLGFVLVNPPEAFRQAKLNTLRSYSSLPPVHLKMKVEVLRTEPGKTPSQEIISWEIWSQGERLRGDMISSGPPSPNQRIVHCLGCGKDDWCLDYTDEKNLAANWKPLTPSERSQMYVATHPRLFGTSSDSIFFRAGRVGIEGLFTAPHEGSETIKIIDVDGQACQQLTWLSGPSDDPILTTLVVSPKQGYRARLIQRETTKRVVNCRYTTTIQMKNWSGIWYPEVITITNKEGEKEFFLETTTISMLESFDIAKSDAFTIAGVGIPEGTFIDVNDDKDGKSGFLKNGEIVRTTNSVESLSAPPTPATDPTERQWNPWLLALSIALGLAAVVLIVLKVRAKRAAS